MPKLCPGADCAMQHPDPGCECGCHRFAAYQRRPETVYATQVLGPNTVPKPARVMLHPVKGYPVGWRVDAAHGGVDADWGDWLLTDGMGGYWPIKDAIFRERYVAVTPAEPAQTGGR